jgi:hypothetical protein
MCCHCFRYFTSYGLACSLLERQLTLVGTIARGRREVPHSFKVAMERAVESTEALYDNEKMIIILSYVPRRNKNVLMLTSSHSSVHLTNDAGKPQIIKDYNSNKGKVFTLFVFLSCYSSQF